MDERSPAADPLACIDCDMLLAAPGEKLKTFVACADTYGKLVRKGYFNGDAAALEQKLVDVATEHKLTGEPGSEAEEDVEDVIDRAIAPSSGAEPRENRYDGDPGWLPDEVATSTRNDTQKPPPKIEMISLPPLTLDEWRSRDLPDPDFIMGYWLTTTSRMLITAATGIGKTNFGLALGMRVAAGMVFLHWQGRRKARVLYIDGEMSRRLLRQRVLDEERRLGITPENFFALSHEDIKGFKPLNTIEGQAWMDALIEKLGGIDLVIADNIMCLTVGDMKDPEPWRQTMPWVLSLTKRVVGQVWIHHTGHDESRSYGDKTREWGLDTVAHFDVVKRDDTDVSFLMTFKKARERTPATRFDFQDVKIALVDDRWDTNSPIRASPARCHRRHKRRSTHSSTFWQAMP
jgi:hypothetical protein